MNRMAENYIRPCYSYYQDEWDELIPAVDFA